MGRIVEECMNGKVSYEGRERENSCGNKAIH
jgi:hypothetical protein